MRQQGAAAVRATYRAAQAGMVNARSESTHDKACRPLQGSLSSMHHPAKHSSTNTRAAWRHPPPPHPGSPPPDDAGRPADSAAGGVGVDAVARQLVLLQSSYQTR